MSNFIEVLATALQHQKELDEEIDTKYGKYRSQLQTIVVEARKGLEDEMREKNVGNQRTGDGKYMMTRAMRKDYRIVDEELVKKSLAEYGLLDKCTRMDLTEVKKIAKKQVIDGIGMTETEVFSWRQASDEAHREQPEETQAEFSARVRADREEK